MAIQYRALQQAIGGAKSTPLTVQGRVPLVVKAGFTAFMLVHLPVDWASWGFLNSLWVCELALKIALVGLWLESPLLLGVSLVGTLMISTLWVLDFAAGALFGVFPFDQTRYMFMQEIPAGIRSLSFYHAWAPLLLLWVVRRTGYDRRSWLGVAALAAPVLLVSFALDTGTGGGDGNLNFVFGPPDMPWPLWLALDFSIFVFLIALPAHLVLRRAIATPEERAAR